MGEAEDLTHGLASANHRTQPQGLFQASKFLFQLSIFPAQPLSFLGLFQNQHHLVGLKGFGDKIISPQLHRLYGRVNGAECRHHDNGRPVISGGGCLEKSNTIHFRHPDVTEDKIIFLLCQLFQSSLAVSDRSGKVALTGQQGRQHVAHVLLIINDQNLLFF